MKIMQLLRELNSGGVERGTLEIARALIAAGHESIVVSNGGRLVAQLEAEGSQHLSLAIHKNLYPACGKYDHCANLFSSINPISCMFVHAYRLG